MSMPNETAEKLTTAEMMTASPVKDRINKNLFLITSKIS